MKIKLIQQTIFVEIVLKNELIVMLALLMLVLVFNAQVAIL